jgi:hypothetical protein
MDHKTDLINFWKTGTKFKGSIFENNLQLTTGEIGMRWFQEATEITNAWVIDKLLSRLKAKLITRPISEIYMYSNAITLYQSTYEVRFFKQDTYAEFNTPFTAAEMYQFILYEKRNL